MKRWMLIWALIVLIGPAWADGETPRMVLVGPPGAGKGTQAKSLQKSLGVPHISTGAMLRDNVARKTELGKKAQEFMSRGALVPDSLIVDIVRDRLSREQSFILDGFPRTLAQARALESMLGEFGKPLHFVVLIEVPDQLIVERLAGRGREDDKPEVVRQRLAVYHRSTEPLVAFYRSGVCCCRLTVRVRSKRFTSACAPPSRAGAAGLLLDDNFDGSSHLRPV